MNPDKLFDYLQGRLPAAERAALEERLSFDKQLQRELAVAQQIYAGMRGDSREILQSPRPGLTALVDVPSNREQEFRAAIESIGGERPGSTTPATATSPSTKAEPGSTLPATVEKKSFVVHIVEAASKQD